MAKALSIAQAGRKADVADRIKKYLQTGRERGDSIRVMAIGHIVKAAANYENIPTFEVAYRHYQGLNGLNNMANNQQQHQQNPSSSQDLLPKSQTNPKRAWLFFKENPFFVLKKLVTPNAGHCFKAPETRGTCRVQFVLNEQDHNLLKSSSKCKLFLLCGAFDKSKPSTDALIEFPQPLEIHFNGTLVKDNVKGLKNKPGTARPANLTPYIAAPNRTNNLDMVYAFSKTDYLIFCYLVEEVSPEKLLQRILANPHIGKQKTLDEFQNGDDEDDIQEVSTRLSLKCPLSFTRLKYPTKSISCKHLPCFDALSFIYLQEQAPTWTCPVCSTPVRVKDLSIDDYVMDIMKNTHEDVETVEIDLDGSWKPVIEGDDNNNSKRGTPGANPNPGTPTNLKREESESSNQQQVSLMDSPVVISLDSDEEDEDQVQAPIQAQPQRGPPQVQAPQSHEQQPQQQGQHHHQQAQTGGQQQNASQVQPQAQQQNPGPPSVPQIQSNNTPSSIPSTRESASNQQVPSSRESSSTPITTATHASTASTGLPRRQPPAIVDSSDTTPDSTVASLFNDPKENQSHGPVPLSSNEAPASLNSSGHSNLQHQGQVLVQSSNNNNNNSSSPLIRKPPPPSPPNTQNHVQQQQSNSAPHQILRQGVPPHQLPQLAPRQAPAPNQSSVPLQQVPLQQVHQVGSTPQGLPVMSPDPAVVNNGNNGGHLQPPFQVSQHQSPPPPPPPLQQQQQQRHPPPPPPPAQQQHQQQGRPLGADQQANVSPAIGSNASSSSKESSSTGTHQNRSPLLTEQPGAHVANSMSPPSSTSSPNLSTAVPQKKLSAYEAEKNELDQLRMRINRAKSANKASSPLVPPAVPSHQRFDRLSTNYPVPGLVPHGFPPPFNVVSQNTSPLQQQQQLPHVNGAQQQQYHHQQGPQSQVLPVSQDHQQRLYLQQQLQKEQQEQRIQKQKRDLQQRQQQLQQLQQHQQSHHQSSTVSASDVTTEENQRSLPKQVQPAAASSSPNQQDSSAIPGQHRVQQRVKDVYGADIQQDKNGQTGTKPIEQRRATSNPIFSQTVDQSNLKASLENYQQRNGLNRANTVNVVQTQGHAGLINNIQKLKDNINAHRVSASTSSNNLNAHTHSSNPSTTNEVPASLPVAPFSKFRVPNYHQGNHEPAKPNPHGTTIDLNQGENSTSTEPSEPSNSSGAANNIHVPNWSANSLLRPSGSVFSPSRFSSENTNQQQHENPPHQQQHGQQGQSQANENSAVQNNPPSLPQKPVVSGGILGINFDPNALLKKDGLNGQSTSQSSSTRNSPVIGNQQGPPPLGKPRSTANVFLPSKRPVNIAEKKRAPSPHQVDQQNPKRPLIQKAPINPGDKAAHPVIDLTSDGEDDDTPLLLRDDNPLNRAKKST